MGTTKTVVITIICCSLVASLAVNVMLYKLSPISSQAIPVLEVGDLQNAKK